MSNAVDILTHEKILHVIKELEQNPAITQRDLALKLKISLGKINYFINALIDKGIIEAKNFKNAKNKLGYMYLLTPEGIRIKFQLIQQFLDWKTREYERLKEELEDYKSMLLACQNVEADWPHTKRDAEYKNDLLLSNVAGLGMRINT